MLKREITSLMLVEGILDGRTGGSMDGLAAMLELKKLLDICAYSHRSHRLHRHVSVRVCLTCSAHA